MYLWHIKSEQVSNNWQYKKITYLWHIKSQSWKIKTLFYSTASFSVNPMLTAMTYYCKSTACLPLKCFLKCQCNVKKKMKKDKNKKKRMQMGWVLYLAGEEAATTSSCINTSRTPESLVIISAPKYIIINIVNNLRGSKCLNKEVS